ncbi:MAG: class I SAM-dependent methyltransferase [Candidatus Bipolaricaulia bacterium]
MRGFTGKKFKVTPLDVQNLSFVDQIEPVIYDGDNMLFEDDRFDVALILTVLHHTPHPEKVINEAKRVSKRIVIIEDIYMNFIQKYLTYFFDSLLNLEFTGHPHTNKNDQEWKALFEQLGLKLKDAKYKRSLLLFKNVTYHLEK